LNLVCIKKNLVISSSTVARYGGEKDVSGADWSEEEVSIFRRTI
jgi:hypothetical protein